jgi:hypothetical protein
LLLFHQRDTTLLAYHPASADMEELSRVTAEYEAKIGAAFLTWRKASRKSREQNEVLMVLKADGQGFSGAP